jgi:predicted nicotinamide N-methyase
VTVVPDPLRRFTLREETVELGGAALTLAVLDDDEVLEAMGRNGAGNPYFGQIWPAARALAEHLWARGGLNGLGALDLGCGPGLAGIAAARLGARVTFADVVPEALALAARNALANGVDPEVAELDLRAPASGRRFDLVLAADLLYEAWLPEAVVATVGSLLASAGRAVVADPGRPHAAGFGELAAAAGFAVDLSGGRGGIRLFTLS